MVRWVGNQYSTVPCKRKNYFFFGRRRELKRDGTYSYITGPETVGILFVSPSSVSLTSINPDCGDSTVNGRLKSNTLFIFHDKQIQ